MDNFPNQNGSGLLIVTKIKYAKYIQLPVFSLSESRSLILFSSKEKFQ